MESLIKVNSPQGSAPFVPPSGFTPIGSPLQILRVDGAGTALEYVNNLDSYVIVDTPFTPVAGTISPGDTVHQALEKLQGNINADDLWDRTTIPNVTFLKNIADKFLVGAASTSATEKNVLLGTSRFGFDSPVIGQASQVEIVGGGFNYGLGVHHFSNDVPSAIGAAILQTSGRGTPASPTPTQSGDLMGGFLVGGVDNTPALTGSYDNGFVINASENWTTTNQGTRARLFLTPNGSDTAAEYLHVTGDGFYGFRLAGSAPSTYYHFMVDGASGSVPGGEQFWFENNNSLNMGFAFPTGSNFQMNIYENAGEQWQLAFDGSANEFRFFNGTIGQFFVQRSTEIVINEAGASVDFRVEGDTNINALFVNGSTNFVGLGIATPDSNLHVFKGSAGSVTAPANTVLTLENSTTAILQFLTPNTNVQAIQFGDPEDQNIGSITYVHSNNQMLLRANDFNMIGITSNTFIGLNFANQDCDVGILDSAAAYNLYSDAGLGFVGIRTSAPNSSFHVEGSLAYAFRATAVGVTLNATDHVLDCTASTITIVLPTAVGIEGREYIVKNSALTGDVTITPNGAETIDGAATYLITPSLSVAIVSTNTGWIVTG